MVALHAVWVLLAATTPGAEDDISFVDAPTKKTLDTSPEALEAHTGREAPFARQLEVPRGEAVFVTTQIRVRGRLPARLRALPADVRGDRGLDTAPWVEIRGVDKGRVSVRYVVRAKARGPEAGKLRFNVELRDVETDKVVATHRIEHQVRLAALRATPEIIRLDQAAYLHHQGLARQAYRALPELKDYLRLDRVDRPPSPKRVPEGKAEHMKAFLHNRLRADVARRHLRAAADLEDPALALAASRALGALSRAPTGPAARARAIEGLAPSDALKLARRALEDLQIDEAEGMVNRIRTSGRLDLRELATSLALLGVIRFLRAKDEAATRALGGALCLNPKLPMRLRRPVLQARLEAARQAGGCPEALAIRAVTATRVPIADGSAIRVEVTLTPDPHEVVSGGEIQVWGFGGEIAKRPSVPTRVVDGLPRLIVELPDDESTRTSDRIILRVIAKDVSGVALVTYGDEDPISVPVANAEIGEGPAVPSWVWYVAGGAALLGGAAVGVWALTREREVVRGVGPIDVRF